ncbi:MAG TPA: mannitol dehydrogenase family protein [Alphaproteobacteria bacterium]|nr:mannitol dehydrogenase family protein [Alphaproteobacteria bacterium]
MDRLSLATMARAPAQFARPAFDPRRLGIGMVHLGIGAFHRAHQAVYTQAALGPDPSPWGIVGVSMRRLDVRRLLAPQDCLYTVVERGETGGRRAIVGTVREILVAPENPAEVVARIAAPTTHVVTLTVTEKGYCLDQATGKIDILHPDIAHDIANPTAPRSAVGILVAAIERRMSDAAGPLSVLSCDNLPQNGRTLSGLVRTLARIRDDRLADWVPNNVAFPSSMVDRIVPATGPEDIAENDASLGLHDEGVVVTEPFRQWVIESRFAGPRPAWEAAGAEIVSDVGPYEQIKLRLLNGSHSALAYLGALAGHERIDQAIGEPDFALLVRRLMDDEVSSTLDVPPGLDLAAYKATLLARFANPVLGHRTRQVAMDGTQKLPQRLLPAIRARLNAGQNARLLALAIAAWMRYATGSDEQGKPFEVNDPLAARLSRIAADAGADAVPLARGYLGLIEVFGEELPRQTEFVEEVTRWLAMLLQKGTRATIAAAVRT